MMNRYYIQPKKNQKICILDVISKNLKINKIVVEKLIYQGSVWNSKQNFRIKDKNFILENDYIVINKPEFPIIEYSLNKDHIKYEDEHFIIVYKEPGLNTCQTPLSDIDCLAYGVQKYYNEKKIKYDVSTINRLDKPTSGLVFYAKNKKMEIALHEMFKNRSIRKLYFAVTPEFNIQKEQILIQDNLEWKNKFSEAITYIKLIDKKDSKFYFLVYPLTGKTHQIRKHFQKYLTPIIGDALYGNYKREDEMQLCCIYYKFKHPDNEKKIIVSYLPVNFNCFNFTNFK